MAKLARVHTTEDPSRAPSEKQHLHAPHPFDMLVLVSVSLLSRVHLRRCCQELVHIAQTRQNRNSAAANSWLLSCYHALPLLLSTPASHPLMIVQTKPSSRDVTSTISRVSSGLSRFGLRAQRAPQTFRFCISKVTNIFIRPQIFELAYE